MQVRVSLPAKGRYPNGAPIAVHITAASRSLETSRACLSEQGFIDVAYLCPSTSRGPLSASCIADVISFATGNTRSLEGKSIQDYVGTVKALTGNAGIIGWSAGGNWAVLAMARHGKQFPGLRWFGSWESPILSPVDGGWGSIFEVNPFYDAATGKIDFERLRYSSEMPLWVWPASGVARQPDWPHGGLYLDGDANDLFNKNADYAFWVQLDVSPPLKAFYTPMVTREARDRKVFGDRWPHHIATLEEVENRAIDEDALRHIPTAVKSFPRLAILVFHSEKGHVTVAADHPHAIAHVNGWLDARAHWVRFNPDVHYIQSAMGKKPSREVQYSAGRKLDRGVVRDLVEAEAEEGGPTDKEGMIAVACELADRTNYDNWSPVLTQILLQKTPHTSIR
ncbi:MAG TPA: hypothetical protein VFB63_02150 [Bryobacteraceae bacterium]|nr:hypothetical protein [Bryobacteraceae bacterium]